MSTRKTYKYKIFLKNNQLTLYHKIKYVHILFLLFFKNFPILTKFISFLK